MMNNNMLYNFLKGNKKQIKSYIDDSKWETLEHWENGFLDNVIESVCIDNYLLLCQLITGLDYLEFNLDGRYTTCRLLPNLLPTSKRLSKIKYNIMKLVVLAENYDWEGLENEILNLPINCVKDSVVTSTSLSEVLDL